MNPRNTDSHLQVRLATIRDAPTIAELVRERVELGLGWTWRPAKVRDAILDADTDVIVATEGDSPLQGVGMMSFGDENGHLSLLAVRADCAHRGIGRQLVEWLELCARSAGMARITLEARESNAEGIAFYKHLGYSPVGKVQGYYGGMEAAVRLRKLLRRDVA
jgi:[ribosomal protein S18]-alanine N-acetyltransferase